MPLSPLTAERVGEAGRACGRVPVPCPVVGTDLWDKRSALEPLAAVLDPADETGRKNAYIHRIHSRALLKFARLDASDHVLDFGCGNGRLGSLLASRARKVTGVDRSEEMIRSARSRCEDERCEFVLYDGERLPFDEATFDALVTAVTLQILCESPDRFRMTVSEIVRTLRPGAQMSMLERMVPTETATEWIEERWRRELRELGVEVERVRPVRGGVTRIGQAIQRPRFPGALLGTAARLDLRLNARRGVRTPYTECLIEARRV